MSEGGQNEKFNNRLWSARKRRSLGQKQVAYLLGQHTVDQISRYEKGLRVPTLEVALQLEIIYRTPLRLLFIELYEHQQEAIRSRAANNISLQAISKDLASGGLNEYCAYAELREMPSVSEADLIPVYDHVRLLAKKLAGL